MRPTFPVHENLFDPQLSALEFRNCLVDRHGFVKLIDEHIINDFGYRHRAESSSGAAGRPGSTGTCLPQIKKTADFNMDLEALRKEIEFVI